MVDETNEFLYKTLFLNIVNGLQNNLYEQSFSSLFGISEEITIEVQERVLNKFKTFLFDVIHRYNLSISECDKRR